MKQKSVNSLKLGVFVLTGLFLLIISLYLLGRNKSFFGSSFELKTQFRAVNGLLVGNNVRFSGIDVGTVTDIQILNDTTLEITMNLEKNMKTVIRRNAVASIGTDGLIGNRVVNIAPVGGQQPFVKGGEMLPSEEEINMDEMLSTLYHTNKNVAKISEEILNTMLLINSSSELSNLLNDKTLSQNLRISLQNLRTTSEKASSLMGMAMNTLKLASEGDGSLATMLTDTSLATELKQVVGNLKKLENSSDRLVKDLNTVVLSVENDINQGNGSVNALLRDSMMADQLRATIDNAAKGSAAFAKDMEALKSNFLFRRYFRKEARREAREKK